MGIKSLFPFIGKKNNKANEIATNLFLVDNCSEESTWDSEYTYTETEEVNQEYYHITEIKLRLGYKDELSCYPTIFDSDLLKHLFHRKGRVKFSVEVEGNIRIRGFFYIKDITDIIIEVTEGTRQGPEYYGILKAVDDKIKASIYDNIYYDLEVFNFLFKKGSYYRWVGKVEFTTLNAIEVAKALNIRVKGDYPSLLNKIEQVLINIELGIFNHDIVHNTIKRIIVEHKSGYNEYTVLKLPKYSKVGLSSLYKKNGYIMIGKENIAKTNNDTLRITVFLKDDTKRSFLHILTSF